MNRIEFLGEDNFTEIMKNDNLDWQKTCTRQGNFQSWDGTTINYYCAIPQNPKAVVTILHGFCEFWGKYHEYAWYLYRAGYAVYFHEQRGHGYSGGKTREPDVVYIDDYETYVQDFKCFLDKVVLPESGDTRKLLLAHSMGGAVAALFLEEYQDYFDAAILSSPMLKMKNNTSPALIKILRVYSKVFHKRKKIAPGQRHFDGVSVFESSSTLSRSRYDYMFEMRKNDWHYQTYGASIGWALASLKATERLMKRAHQIKIPITVFTAGDDHLIDPEGYEQFKKLVPQAVFITFDNSRHEIFNSDESSRKKYFTDVLETLDGYLNMK
jgi:lysophospholipase